MPTSAQTFVLDVSGNQPADISWSLVKGAGIAAIWAKATDGVRSPDGHFMVYALMAKAAGLLVGAYHYLRVRAGGDDAQDGVAQADEFCDRYIAAQCELPPMCDVETNGNPKVETSSWITLISQFVTRVTTRLQKIVIVYTSRGEWESFGLTSAVQFAGLPLWLANTTPNLSSPTPPAPWTTFKLWQYSWKGRVPGISGDVDVSVFNGTLDELRAWAGISVLDRLRAVPLFTKLAVATGVLTLALLGVTVSASSAPTRAPRASSSSRASRAPRSRSLSRGKR